MSRYNLSYRYSLDYGTNWIDLSDIVDSSQTSIVHNLCSAGFKSQKDTASFTIPAVQSAVKQNLINALIDNSTILVEIKENTNVIFTGYVDKDSISIRSYPLTSTLTLELTDVSTKALDDKVEEYIYLKEKTVTQIVHYLLTKAGYSYDSSIVLPSDEITLEAFVVDKDDSDTYREYIDTLLFEVGGYVLDFTEKGIARIVKIDWKASGTASVVDNPMISNGVTTKTNILKEDGVSLKWASTKWSADNNQLLWQDSISRKLEDNYIVGEDVENEAYWPEDGELSPVYQEYNADLLDTDYLTNATRKQNEDLAIIAAEDIRAEIQATKNNEAFTSWQYPIIQDFVDDYGLTENPIAYPKKAWYLLRNNSGATVNIQHFRLYGKVFYRDKLQTLKTKNTKNPKEYESKYIYSETHANQFLQFYWHFLQTSRTSVSWKEVNSEHTLGDVVQVYHKGSLSYIKAVIAGITTTFIGTTKITSYSAVGVAAQIVPFPTISLIATKGSDSSRSILGVADVYATSQTQAGTKTDWQKTIPSLSAKNKFLWQKETIHYTDSTKSEVVALIGTYGDKGDSGTGISTIDEYYAVSSSDTTEPTVWYPTVQTMTPDNRFLWNYEVITYTDDTTPKETAKRVIGAYGQQGIQGEPGGKGDTGNGISSITNYYLATSEESGVTKDTSGWNTDPTTQVLSPTLKCLWNYEKIIYTDETYTETNPCIIGTYGEKGETGAKGDTGDSITIVEKSVQYASSTSGTATPSAWDTEPSPVKGQYLWSKTYIKYSDGTENTSYAVAYIGTDGTDGEDGTSPTLSSQAVQYQTSTSASAPPTDETKWTSTASPVKGQYLWVRVTLTYSDGKKAYAYSVSYTAQDGASVSLEYSYSPSPDWCYTEDIYWQDDEIFWGTEKALWNSWASGELTEKDGQYIWMRSRVGDGSWQYTRLTGVQAKLFQLSATATTITRNDRLSGTGQVTFFATIQGYYGATPALYIDDTKCTLEYSEEKQKYYYIFTYEVKNASKVTAYLYNGDMLMDSLVLDVVDNTEQAFYVGVVDTLPTELEDGVSLLSGDTVFCSADNIVYVYGTHNGTLGWHKTTEYTLAELGYDKQAKALSWAMTDALSTIDAGSVSQSDYAYFNNLIVGLITAKYISSMQIQLQSSGVISSSEISTDTSEDINSQGFLTKNGFRLEDSGAIRANEFYFGTDKDGNRIVFDTTSLRCIDSNGKILWELKPDGTATFSSKVSASDLTAQGEISATSLTCNAITTQESIEGASCTNPTFTKELFPVETAYNLIKAKYLDNTIRSQTWTYNSKTINYICCGNYPITEQVNGVNTNGNPLIFGKKYYNARSVSAGDSHAIINTLYNNYSFPIWVYAYVSLSGSFNEIHSTFYFNSTSYCRNGEDRDAWMCLMPGQGVNIWASSSAWWGTQTGYGNIQVYPTYKNFTFATDPVEVTSVRGQEYYWLPNTTKEMFTIDLPNGHPSTIVLILNGNTSDSSGSDAYTGINLAETGSYIMHFIAYNGDTSLGEVSHSFSGDDHYTWLHTLSNIPSTATKIVVKINSDDGAYYLKINRLTYALCYNYEAHNALIRYDDGSLQYLGTAQEYVKGNFSAVENTRYTSTSVYTLIKNSFKVSEESYELKNGEYNITSDTSITLDGTTYTNMSKMIVTDDYISFYGSTTSCIIYSSGYNTTGQGQAQQGGFLGDSYSSVSANITLLSQQLGAYTASLFAKDNNTYDIGSSDMRYRQAYINSVIGNVNSAGDTEHKVYGAVFN